MKAFCKLFHNSFYGFFKALKAEPTPAPRVERPEGTFAEVDQATAWKALNEALHSFTLQDELVVAVA